MADEKIIKRFRNESLFHNMVKYLEKGLLDKTYTLQDLKDAYELAVERYEVRKLMGWIDE